MTADHVERVKAFYGLDKAPPGEGARAPRVLGFIPDVSAVESLRLRERAPLTPGAVHCADHYVGADEADVHVIVGVAEYPDAAGVRDGLAAFLANVMTAPLPTCRDRGLAIGALCFCDFGEPPQRIVFGRGNLLIDVASAGRAAFPVAALAAIIDRQIEDRLRTLDIPPA
jgi:hypothetical protein